MAREDAFFETVEELPGGEDWVPTDWEADVIFEVEDIVYTGSCDVYWEHDKNKNGEYEVSVQICTFDGEGISQQNAIKVNTYEDVRLRIENTSEEPADYVVMGSMW